MRHEDELRRLLRGGPIPAEDEQLAQVLRQLRSTLSTPPAEDVAGEHLAAITGAATDAAHHAPTVEPVGRLRRWGRRVAAAGAVKVATVATVAAAATGGGLAATGSLPQPVQQQVSDVLSNVGVSVPSGRETAEDARPDDPGTTPDDDAVVETAPPTSTPPTGTPADDVADEEAPTDVPEGGPAEPDDEPIPFEEPPEGEPDETPSDAGSENRTGPPADDAVDDAPAEPSDGTSEQGAERSGAADAYTEDDRAPDGSGDHGSGI